MWTIYAINLTYRYQMCYILYKTFVTYIMSLFRKSNNSIWIYKIKTHCTKFHFLFFYLYFWLIIRCFYHNIIFLYLFHNINCKFYILILNFYMITFILITNLTFLIIFKIHLNIRKWNIICSIIIIVIITTFIILITLKL